MTSPLRRLDGTFARSLTPRRIETCDVCYDRTATDIQLFPDEPLAGLCGEALVYFRFRRARPYCSGTWWENLYIETIHFIADTTQSGRSPGRKIQPVSDILKSQEHGISQRKSSIRHREWCEHGR